MDKGRWPMNRIYLENYVTFLAPELSPIQLKKCVYIGNIERKIIMGQQINKPLLKALVFSTY